MADDTVLKMMASEFKLWGVKVRTENTNGGHIRLIWQASPDKELRNLVIPKTGSDHRSWLNCRAQIRRMFAQDGLSLTKPAGPKQTAPTLARALTIPQDVETDRDQFKAMRAEIADLTNMVLELATEVGNLCSAMKSQAADDIPAFIPGPVMATPKKPGLRAIKAIDFVTPNWNTTAALAVSMGVEPTIAYRKLYHLMKQEKVELSQGQWRRAPPPAPKLNGKHPRTGMHA